MAAPLPQEPCHGASTRFEMRVATGKDRQATFLQEPLASRLVVVVVIVIVSLDTTTTSLVAGVVTGTSIRCQTHQETERLLLLSAPPPLLGLLLYRTERRLYGCQLIKWALGKGLRRAFRHQDDMTWSGNVIVGILVVQTLQQVHISLLRGMMLMRGSRKKLVGNGSLQSLYS